MYSMCHYFIQRNNTPFESYELEVTDQDSSVNFL